VLNVINIIMFSYTLLELRLKCATMFFSLSVRFRTRSFFSLVVKNNNLSSIYNFFHRPPLAFQRPPNARNQANVPLDSATSPRGSVPPPLRNPGLDGRLYNLTKTIHTPAFLDPSDDVGLPRI